MLHKSALSFLIIAMVCCFPNWSAGLPSPVTTYCNISAGKFYTFSKTANPTYPDIYPNKWTAGSNLTDEVAGTGDTETWVGWYDDNAYVAEITADLGKVYTIDTVKLQLQSNTSWGIYLPDSMEIYVRSNTTESWVSYGSAVSFPSDTASYSSVWAQGNGGPAQCRYVKYRLNVAASHHLFVGELEIWGNVINTFRGAPDWGCYNGCYASTGSYVWDVNYFETTTGAKVSMALWYHYMNPTENPAESDFTYMGRWWNKNSPTSTLGGGLGTGIYGYRYLEVGWLAYYTPAATIASGGTDNVYDNYFETWFTKSIDPNNRNGNTDPIWIRPMNEFNGNWTFDDSANTGYLRYGGNPTAFKAAWRRMYNIAEQVNAADKQIFVWSPQAVSAPAASWNMPDKYYPGDQYVDWIGLSLYSGNMGGLCTNVYPMHQLDGTGGPGCFDFLSHWSYKPLMIAEGGWCWRDGSNGTQWINGWFDMMRSVPRLKAAVWFETDIGDDLFDIRKWSQDKIDLFKTRVADDYSLKNPRAGRVDYNKDNSVNFQDFSTLTKDWSPTRFNYAFRADINGDYYVNLKDLLIFAENWLK